MLSKNLRNITSSGGNDEDIAKHIKEINDMVKRVICFLRSSLKVDTSASEKQAQQKYTSLLAIALIAVIGAAGSIPTLPLTLAALGSIGVGTTIGGVMIFRSSGVTIEEYLDVLKLALLETSQWSNQENQVLDFARIVSSEEAFESELIRRVQAASPEFKKMVEALNTKSLRSEFFHDATTESRLRFLTRIKVVVDTLSLWDREVNGKHFMGVFGAEDSGKSTFIKRILQGHGWTGSLPETGIQTHTTVVRSYQVSASMWLVDFPGSNGVGSYADGWKQYTALSNSAVLLLEFEFDIKRDQVNMYHEMKESLKTVVVVVFNKVDEKFTSRHRPIFTDKYFEEQRVKNAKVLGCNTNDVYFASLDPDSAEIMADLRMRGVLGFEELVQELVAKEKLFLNTL